MWNLVDACAGDALERGFVVDVDGLRDGCPAVASAPGRAIPLLLLDSVWRAQVGKSLPQNVPSAADPCWPNSCGCFAYRDVDALARYVDVAICPQDS